MKPVLYFILAFTLQNNLFAQVDVNELYRKKYFANFNTYPDSSYFYGSKLIQNLAKEPDTIKAKDYHNFAIYFLYTNQKDSAAFYLNKSLKYGNENNNIKTQITLGGLYKKNGDYAKAKSIFNILLKYKLSKRDLGITHSELGSLYSLSDDFEKAKYHFEQGLTILEESEQAHPLAMCRMNFGNFYKKNNLPQKALPLLQKSSVYFLDVKSWRDYYLCEINIAFCYLFINNQNAASKVLNNIDNTTLLKLDDKFVLAAYYNLKATVFDSNKEHEKAVHFYKKSIETASKNKAPETFSYINSYLKYLLNKEHIEAMRDMLKTKNIDSLYQSGNLFDKTDYLKIIVEADLKDEIIQNKLKEFLSLTDSLQKEQGKIFSSELNGTISKLKEQEQEANSLKSSKNFWILSSTFFLISIIFGFYFYRKKNKANKEILSQEKKKISNDLNDKLAINKKQSTATTKKLIEAELVNIKLTDELQKFKKDLTEESSKDLLDSHWKRFIERFNLMNPDFNANLKINHPNLTSKEIELCSLLKLDLTNKEIAQILKIEYRSVIKKKQRIKKKLQLDPLVNLENFILNFK